MPEVPSGAKAVGQAVKDTSLPVESFLGERGESLVPGPSGTLEGDAVPAPLREAKLVSSAASVSTGPEGAVQLDCGNDFLRDESQ